MRYPAGFQRADQGPEDRAEETFVVEGEIAIGKTEHGYHGYGFTPRGESAGDRSTTDGATLLVFRYGRDDPNSASGPSAAITVDPTTLPWDMSASDGRNRAPAPRAQGIAPWSERQFAHFPAVGLPHGMPPADAMPAEIHDHFEEMFMLQGEMWTPEGRIRPGAYFYRPPGIVHGPHVSLSGFFQIMRAGANYVRTEWTAPVPLPIGAPYNPAIPEGTPESWTRPYAGPDPY